uniref:Uncharacterized protein n=1 Tax=Sphaerodactylus townsendi TaxID=933632 RepID=A0ACB8FK26_9SAUR
MSAGLELSKVIVAVVLAEKLPLRQEKIDRLWCEKKNLDIANTFLENFTSCIESLVDMRGPDCENTTLTLMTKGMINDHNNSKENALEGKTEISSVGMGFRPVNSDQSLVVKEMNLSNGLDLFNKVSMDKVLEADE